MNSGRATWGSQTSLREANRARVVDAVRQHGGLTQVELAGATGLSPATVSNIVKELSTAGVLATSPATRSGRRAQQVTIARDLGLVAGVHVGTRTLRVALADTSGHTVADRRMPLARDHRADDVLDRTALLIADMLESVDAEWSELLAAGLGLPAPVDGAQGIVVVPGILAGWDGVPAADVLSRRIGAPVFADNDANLGALAEWRHGAGRGTSTMAYIRASHRIGSGLIVDGRAFRGAGGAAGEIGHVTIDEDGQVCRCGNRGCLEGLAGGEAIVEALRPSHGPLTLRDVIRHAAEGDVGCRRVLADAGRHLGVAAASLCNLLDPECLVIGGELAEAGDTLIEPMRTTVASRALPTRREVSIATAELGPEAEVTGAITLAVGHAARLAAP